MKKHSNGHFFVLLSTVLHFVMLLPCS